MKCRSVACLWSGAPPSHRVTATASITNPPTLYTGGSDGSIIWWNISSSSESNSEVKPIAMLCGHTAPMVDLAVCDPTTVSGNGVTADLQVAGIVGGEESYLLGLEEQESLLMADSSGRLQLVPVSENSEKGEDVSESSKDSVVSRNWLNEGEIAVSVITRGNLVAFFSKNRYLGEIVTASDQHSEKSTFIQLRQNLLRVESTCCDVEQPSHSRLDPKGSASAETGISHSGSQCSTEKGLQSFVSDNRQCVSSSMVISEKMYVPYAAVYGFFSGEIEIAKFDFLHRLDSCASSPRSDTDSLVSRQRLLGHTGFVLSLAAHRMFRDANGCNSSHVDLRKYGLHHPHLAPCVCLYLN
ncbi:unnamed protein product [Arabidopsis arenosa]|uniref:Uncharacterized protein n=1 Tax=Arabidopsis arenosa TaxID=38785 RepID=A0A8S2AKK0_ARAAE|nr:unnamed protein product [Arabidopsis arenosa]